MRLLPALGAVMVCLAAEAQEVVELPAMVVEARRLDEARNSISPTLGANVSTLKRENIENLPQGADAPINQLLLQFPGAVQDSFGEIHVRGEHRNLQYRLNGVTLPEGIQGFGAFLDGRSVASLSLLTGSLPAQFGFHPRAGVDIDQRAAPQNQRHRGARHADGIGDVGHGDRTCSTGTGRAGAGSLGSGSVLFHRGVGVLMVLQA